MIGRTVGSNGRYQPRVEIQPNLSAQFMKLKNVHHEELLNELIRIGQEQGHGPDGELSHGQRGLSRQGMDNSSGIRSRGKGSAQSTGLFSCLNCFAGGNIRAG